jgi:hypothetical protein
VDRRDLAGILFAAVPVLGFMLTERLVGGPMDALIESGWAPFFVGLSAFLIWLTYVFSARRLLGPTRGDLQEALDKMIDYHYKEDSEGNPRPGITGEGLIREHAPMRSARRGGRSSA